MLMNLRWAASLVTIALCTFTPSPANTLIDAIAPPEIIFEALALNGDLSTPQQPKYLSPTDIVSSRDEKTLYVAEQTAKRIDVVSLETKTVISRIPLPNEVTGLARSPDGAMLYATCSSDRWLAGQVCVIDATTGAISARIAVGSGARAPVVSPDGKILYVCNRFDDNVSVINLSTRREIGRIAMSREPYCAAVTPDGKTLVVGNFLPADLMADTQKVSSKIALVDVATSQVTAEIMLTSGSGNVQGIAVSADGKYAFATHLIGSILMIGTTVERGWLQKNVLAVIDLERKKFLNDVSLDFSVKGLGNPWTVRTSNDGKYLLVSHAGSGDLSIINYAGFIEMVVAKSDSSILLYKDFTALDSCRKVVSTGLQSPRALAIAGNRVYCAGFYSDSAPAVISFDLQNTDTVPTPVVSLGGLQVQTTARRGEALFYDASLCFQKWQSCHSCHPDGRSDGRFWILGGGTVVAPRNTKSLVYSRWGATTTWSGRRSSASAVASAIELQLFRVPAPEYVMPIDTFLLGVRPAVSPHRLKGALSESASSGKALFSDTGRADCIKCHSGQRFTDGLLWSGVFDPYESNTKWQTPSLPEVWRSAPYGHLGSLSMKDMILLPTHNNAGTKLTTQEIDDLLAYVKSL